MSYEVIIQVLMRKNEPRVGLYGSSISATELKNVIDALENHSELTSFDFSTNCLEQPELFANLFMMLKQCISLQELGFAIGSSLTPENLTPLWGLIADHPNLKDISITKDLCEEKDFKDLINSVNKNKNLTTFQLMVDNISDTALMHGLTQLVQQNQLVIISWHNIKEITFEQVKSLVKTLDNNNRLQQLTLHFSSHTDNALTPLFAYLKSNTTLTQLGLGSICNPTALQQLAEALKDNPTLKTLAFRTAATAECLNKAYIIAQNKTLTYFELDVPSDDLESNPALQALYDKILREVRSHRILHRTTTEAKATDHKNTPEKRSASALYNPLLSSSSSTSYTSKEPSRKRLRLSPDENTSKNKPTDQPPTLPVKS